MMRWVLVTCGLSGCASRVVPNMQRQGRGAVQLGGCAALQGAPAGALLGPPIIADA